MRAERLPPGSWARVKALFERAAESDAAARDALLERECAGDTKLRAAVERLLRADADEGRAAMLERGALLELPRGRVLAGGEALGPFTVSRVIASGGMGTVYEAMQDQPRRKVALKTLRFDLRSPRARRRFEYEAEVMSQLKHPGIAQVYAAGTLAEPGSGREVPYFAMELIDGAQPLTSYVRSARLSRVRALALFATACDAIQHGHQRGFVHRDIKPSNLLVDAAGAVKVIDFGVARALAPEPGTSMLTATDELVGTLAYMSPEQLDLEPDAADTRADVYALGVVLFELLTGERPFDLTGTSLTSAARRLRETDAPRPSTRARGIPAELDWITGKALERDRERRYASVSELAEDVRRHLRNDAVLAGPPSLGYRLRKLAGRHKVAALAGAVVAAGLVTGVLIALHGLREARAEAETTNAVNEWFQWILGSPAPSITRGEALTVRELIDQAAARIEHVHESRPRLAAQLRTTIGMTYLELGADERAFEQLSRAEELAAAHLPPEHPARLAVLCNLGTYWLRRDDFDKAEALLERAYAGRRRALGDDTLATAAAATSLAKLHFRRGNLERAEALYRAAREGASRHRASNAHVLAAATNGLGLTLLRRGQPSDAETLLEEAVALATTAYGADFPTALDARNNLAQAIFERGDVARANAAWLELLASYARVFGAGAEKTRVVMNNVAAAFKERGHLAEAEAWFRRALTAAPGEQAVATLITRSNLAVCLEGQAKLAEARELFESVIAEARERKLGSHWLMGAFLKGYGVTLMRLGAHDEAERALQRALRLLSAKFGDETKRVQAALRALIELYEASGRPERAAELRGRLAK